VHLDIWCVRRYRGEVAAREGQLLKWVTLTELTSLPLLDADWPIVERLATARIPEELSRSRARSARPE
jgi:8-oxo-dGTP diphosphatase